MRTTKDFILRYGFRMPEDVVANAFESLGIDLQIKSPIARVLDWLVGENDYEESPYYRHLDEVADYPTRSPAAAPILKLNSAILQQAVTDQATRIDLYTGLGDQEVHSVETLTQYEERIQWDRVRSRADFARVMAEAGVKQGEPTKNVTTNRLTVVYTFGYLQLPAMTIPANLLDPCIRAYPFAFNYQRCTTTSRPENLLYFQTKTNAAYASIDHYDRQSNHLMGVVLEYEK